MKKYPIRVILVLVVFCLKLKLFVNLFQIKAFIKDRAN
ncbi:hypothetical protein FM106_06795 [Brachybacterium faecium]|nr:hypothetical protein FM106_06795 [Brachybacterium faecium]